jgi:hypothetical protein
MTRTVRQDKERLDRQSRNGTSDDPRQPSKKQGGGRGNWGTFEDDVALAKDELDQPLRQRKSSVSSTHSNDNQKVVLSE